MRFLDILLGIVALTLAIGVVRAINPYSWSIVADELNLPPVLKEGWKPSSMMNIPVIGDVIAGFSMIIQVISSAVSLGSGLLTALGVPTVWANAITGCIMVLATLYLIYFISGRITQR